MYILPTSTFCTIPGLVNVDFANVRAIVVNARSSLMGIGTATVKFTKPFVGILLIHNVT